MSKAREIAEERFAKGEISAEELDQIRKNLSSESAGHSAVNYSTQSLIAMAGKPVKWLGIIFLALFIGNIFLVIPGDEAKFEQAKKNGSSDVAVLEAELKDIKNRTNIFLFVGFVLSGAGFLMGKALEKNN